MLPSDTMYSCFLICQIFIGVLANSFLFMICIYTLLIQPHLKRPIDCIFMYLTVVNIVTIVFQSIPDIMLSFGVKRFLDNAGCQTFLYTCRVSWGLSICTTSLLSAVQAITISPSHSKWAWLKSKWSTWIFPSFLFFWIINTLMYIHIIETIRAKLNFTVVGQGYVNAYCQSRKPRAHESRSFVNILVIHDVVFLALMIWSSVYMVWILYRHCLRAQHFHNLSPSSKTSPEIKASHTILCMVFCFVFFYFSYNCLMLYGFYESQKNVSLGSIRGFLASCYPTISPFFSDEIQQNYSQIDFYLSNLRMTFLSNELSVADLTSSSTEESPSRFT